MAKATQSATDGSHAPAASPRSSLIELFLTGLVALVGGVSGFLVPRLLLTSPAEPTPEAVAARAPSVPSPRAQPGYVPFGDVVVNLNEPRLNRYLRLKLSLEVPADSVGEVARRVEQERAVLKNWLIAYLSDKQLDEVRGATGVNRLRREIRDAFNRLLFSDGSEKVQSVLVEEFNIQ
jgi:flagellar basal body-associated protein FliL